MRQHEKKKKDGGWYYRLELSKKRSLWGLIFLLPWLLGFLLFFLKPLAESISYSFNTVTIVEGGINKSFIGLDNYIRALTQDTVFNRLVLSMVMSALPKVLIVIIFSLLVAILINGKYPGRGIARTIFFIPIIMGTSIAGIRLPGNDIISLEVSGSLGATGFGSKMILDILTNTGLPTEIVGYVSGAVGNIFSILAVSGVPTLIFLAGLQSISPSLYEVAQIEGASAYETFWKLTLPMVSPMVLLCTVYSIIDAFFRHRISVDGVGYGMIDYMRRVGFSSGNYGLGAAMTTIYMLVSVAIIAVISFLISRVVFYYD
jgi:ABC-type sugar transport system permease subunit